MKKLFPYSIKHIFIFTGLFFLLNINYVFSQEKVIDQVIAIVGKNIILSSDIEGQYFQYRMQEDIRGSASTVKCQILENLLFQKLLLNQAQIDSTEVSDSQVEQSMDQRIRYYVAQFGSQEKLEKFYDKTILEIKDEMRELVKDQMLSETIQQEITQNTNITPSDVKSFFRKIPKDSLPLINTEYEIGQIVKKPPISVSEKLIVKEKLNTFRQRILNDESFSTLAILYSEDPGSAKTGGEVGLSKKGELYPEFEAVAFNLKKSEVSEIVETEAGFHILQLIERKGEYINVRHILIQTKPSPLDLLNARNFLDSVATLIENDSITFEKAVIKFSDDPGKINGGLLINPMTGTTQFEADQLDPKVFFVIDKLKVHEISNPVPFITEDGKDAYRLLYLNVRTMPHRANLREDYDRIQNWALEEKNYKVISDWIKNKATKTYVKIIDEYKNCDFQYKWF